MAGWDDEAECPICGTVVDAFNPGGHAARPRPDCRCPTCGSLERHRAFWLFFRERTTLFTDAVRLLQVAPDKSLGSRLGALPNVDYLSADLDPSRAMVGMDLTSIDLPDPAFAQSRITRLHPFRIALLFGRLCGRALPGAERIGSTRLRPCR